ncbi:Leucine-rich repeat - like 10 [Theobroma cacao]|nr:Leucine-rich repeat - like 10 [Theobroma cacao]
MSISILDLSNNKLSGAIPDCLISKGKIPNLTVLDLHTNKFHGNIPDSFVVGNKLQILNLNNNDFDGPLPKSLENCHDLQVLNLGNNKINDTFPHWLGTLPRLEVLVLRSTYFHGQIRPSENESHFPALGILDLSHNEFSGFLPTTYFKNFRGMMNLSNVLRKSMEDFNLYYHFFRACHSERFSLPGVGEQEPFHALKLETTTLKRLAQNFSEVEELFLAGIDMCSVDPIHLVNLSSSLTSLSLDDCGLNGTFSDIIFQFPNLKLLKLGNNPDLLVYLPKSNGTSTLEVLDLKQTILVGELSDSIRSLKSLKSLNVASWSYSKLNLSTCKPHRA